MKSLICLALFGIVLVAQSVVADVKCEGVNSVEINGTIMSMDNSCKAQMVRQIQMEIDASISYLQMGAYFAQDNINRPGFAHLFFHAANEEREHATKLIDYLLMRGEVPLNKLIRVNVNKDLKFSDGVNGLKDALDMEAKVTASIRNVIKACEGGNNDYHLVDYLTGVFLEEQYSGQRDLAGKLATLQKMNNGNPLGEFLFDKTLLA